MQRGKRYLVSYFVNNSIVSILSIVDRNELSNWCLDEPNTDLYHRTSSIFMVCICLFMANHIKASFSICIPLSKIGMFKSL